MKGKKVNTEFVVKFIEESITNGFNTKDLMLSMAQSKIEEIDLELKQMYDKKILRSNLLDVVHTLKDKNNTPKKKPYYRFNYNLCSNICAKVAESESTIEDLIIFGSKADVIFCLKELIQDRILIRKNNKFAMGENFEKIYE